MIMAGAELGVAQVEKPLVHVYMPRHSQSPMLLSLARLYYADASVNGGTENILKSCSGAQEYYPADNSRCEGWVKPSQ